MSTTLPPVMFAEPGPALECLADMLDRDMGAPDSRNAVLALRQALPLRRFENITRTLPDGFSVRVVTDYESTRGLAVFHEDRLVVGPVVVSPAMVDHLDAMRRRTIQAASIPAGHVALGTVHVACEGMSDEDAQHVMAEIAKLLGVKAPTSKETP